MISKKRLTGLIVCLIVVAMPLNMALAGKGNNVPSGPHYNLNIIGMDKIDKKADIGCGEGHRIFVPMEGKSKIMLTEGDDFAVLDCVATSASPAEFQLPNPDPDNTGTTEYSVYFRLRGKPGGRVIMATCATDPLEDVELCSDARIVAVRETGHGKNKFENVSKELLYIYAWVCVDYNEVAGVCEEYEYMRVPLFDDTLEEYFWSYDNNGARIAQLRFYEGVQTTVPDPLKSISPACVEPDSSGVTVTLESSPKYADFSAGVADVDFGDDIQVTDTNPVDNDTLEVTIDVGNKADLGTRTVIVTLNDESQLMIGFQVADTCS